MSRRHSRGSSSSRDAQRSVRVAGLPPGIYSALIPTPPGFTGDPMITPLSGQIVSTRNADGTTVAAQATSGTTTDVHNAGFKRIRPARNLPATGASIFGVLRVGVLALIIGMILVEPTRRRRRLRRTIRTHS